MFSLGRLPKLARDRDAALDFIPIGQRIISPEKLQSRPSTTSRVPLTADKIDNTHIESSFDETTHQFDSLNAEDIGVASGTSRGTAGWNSRGNIATSLGTINRFAENKQSSIQELQADSQQLKLENYNLKVEVATLKQFLKQTPPETQDLMLHNASLKQELLKTQDELEQLKQSSRIPSAEALEAKHQFEALKRLYNESLEEKDDEIRRLQRQIAEASEPRPSPIPQDLLDKVEFLQNENQALLRQLDGFSAASDKTKNQFQSENNELRLELHRLKAQLADVPSDAGEQLDHLRDSNNTLQRKLKSISEDLQQAEDERESLRASLRKAQIESLAKQEEINQLSRSKEESASSKSRSLREVDSKLERAHHELEDLKLKLKRSEAALTLATEDRDSETQRLQRKIESLMKELKDKDNDEYNLRAQLRSLMEDRSRTSDNQSTIKHYQAQIDALQVKEKSLHDENHALKEDMARVQDEMYSHNIDASRVSKLKQENADLIDRLEFYEKEYALTQEAMEGLEAELDQMKISQKRIDSERHSLETELESMRTKLRRSELNESRKYNESAYMELEEQHRVREEADRRRMQLQIEALNTQIKGLEKQLETAKHESRVFPNVDTYQPPQDNRLRSELQSKDFELQERQRELNKLQNVLKDKEDLVEALEERIRKLNKDFRMDFTAEDRYRDTLQKLKFDHESELLAVLLERDRLQTELKHYKTRLEALDNDDTFAQTSANSVTIALLEAQLDEFRRKNNELLADLSKVDNARQDFSNKEVEEYRAKIRELRFALNDAQLDKSELEMAKDTLESDLSLLRSEKARFETRNRSLSQELAKNARSCTRLANKVQDLESQLASLLKNADDAHKAQKANLYLQSQLDQLGAKLASTGILLQPNRNLDVTKSRLQENELKYFKAKLFELQTRYLDLALMNSFMVSSIRQTSDSCKDDLVRMALYGIYPDYSALKRTNKKLTMKTLATFVLGMVRMKRRTEKAKAREVKLAQLRGDIERDRITLLVEK